jgi:hypothetical protein
MTSRGSIGLSGLIDGDVAAIFGESLAGLGESDLPVEIDLGRARVAEASIAQVVAEAIRQTALRLGAVRVVSAPKAIRELLTKSPGLTVD